MEHIVPWIQVIGGSVVHVPLDPFELPIRCTRTPDGFILPGPVGRRVNARNVVEHEILDVHLRLYVRIVGRIRHVIRRDELFELRPGKAYRPQWLCYPADRRYRNPDCPCRSGNGLRSILRSVPFSQFISPQYSPSMKTTQGR